MKKIILFLFLLALPFVLRAEVANLVFTNEQRTVAPGEISQELTLQMQDLSGNPVAPGETVDLEFSSTSQSGEFLNSSGNAASTTWNSNWQNRIFYYRDSVVGTHTLTIKAIGRTSSGSWTATQQIIVSVGNQGQQEQNQQEEPNSEGADQWVMDNKSISVDAGGDRTVVAGARYLFEGVAYGLKGEPLTSASFLWNFGNGSVEHGDKVFYTYHFPGKYSAVFSASTANYSDSDSIVVTVLPSPIFITELKPGEGGWIELFNDSEYELDVSGWGVSNGRFAFYFPGGSKILPGSYLALSADVLGLTFAQTGGAQLLYPGGKEIDNFAYSGVLKADESFHNINGQSRIGLTSPGEGKFVVRVVRPPTYGPARSINSVNKNNEDAVAVTDTTDNMQRGSTSSQGEGVETQNVAAVAQSQTDKSLLAQTWFWLILALTIALFSAGGFLAVKKYFVKSGEEEDFPTEAEYNL